MNSHFLRTVKEKRTLKNEVKKILNVLLTQYCSV